MGRGIDCRAFGYSQRAQIRVVAPWFSGGGGAEVECVAGAAVGMDMDMDMDMDVNEM